MDSFIRHGIKKGSWPKIFMLLRLKLWLCLQQLSALSYCFVSPFRVACIAVMYVLFLLSTNFHSCCSPLYIHLLLCFSVGIGYDVHIQHFETSYQNHKIRQQQQNTAMLYINGMQQSRSYLHWRNEMHIRTKNDKMSARNTKWTNKSIL